MAIAVGLPDMGINCVWGNGNVMLVVVIAGLDLEEFTRIFL